MKLGRLVLGVVLMVVYVVVALATVVGLLWVAKAVVFEVRSLGAMVLGLACAVAAGVITVSVWPRRGRFEQPLIVERGYDARVFHIWDSRYPPSRTTVLDWLTTTTAAEVSTTSGLADP